MDAYPYDEVILTRTMSEKEKKSWGDKRVLGSQFGSDLMQQVHNIKYKPVSFATAGYWNDSPHWWQDQIEITVPKKEVRKWVKEGRAYLTPLGIRYYTDKNPARPLVEDTIPLPFEFVSKQASLNKDLQKHYLSTADSDRALAYRKVGQSRSQTLYGLGMMDKTGPLQSYLFGPSPKIPEPIRTELKDRIETLLKESDTKEKYLETALLIDKFLAAVEAHSSIDKISKWDSKNLKALKEWRKKMKN